MKKLNKYLFLLYFFHVITFFLIFIIFFLNHLHNSNGTWNFMKDSLLYHNESLILLNYLETNNFIKFITSFNEHINTK